MRSRKAPLEVSMKTNPGYIRLTELKEVSLSYKHLSKESVAKIMATVEYSMGLDPNQDRQEVLGRCAIAQLAEQHVAEWLEGWVNHGNENTDDPLSYAFDVLGNIKYNGIRVEVKTHQNQKSNFITIHSKGGQYFSDNGYPGVNVRPFLEAGVADVIVIFDAIENSPEDIRLTPRLLCDPHALIQPRVVNRSNFRNGGYYINNKSLGHLKHMLNIHTF